jgi:NAD(P)-dependent dehydrogenase (short-subunit alcohol dehydrogenase family)
MDNLSNQAAIVAGAGGKLGKPVVEAFLNKGVRVIWLLTVPARAL